MQIELNQIQHEVRIAFVYVTHDQEEALTMSDVIVVMRDGIIQQQGAPEDLYRRPVNRFVTGFIGSSNFVDATLVDAPDPAGLFTFTILVVGQRLLGRQARRAGGRGDTPLGMIEAG